jgi:hypothetical protein
MGEVMWVRELRLVAVALILHNAGAGAQSQQSDPLNQFEGLWTAKWTVHGATEIEQVLFTSDPSDVEKRIASLPFLAGQTRIFRCSGLGCNGADLVVSGTGFDCLYAHSRYNEDRFAWTFKGGTNTAKCPPDAEFTRVQAVKEDEVQNSDINIEQKDQNLNGINIYYYTKEIDGNIVSSALNNAGIQFTPAESIKTQDMPTVNVEYGSDVSLPAIKKVSLVLIRGGVQLKVLNLRTDIRPKSLLINAYVVDDESIPSLPLSEVQVSNLSRRPRLLFNPYVRTIDVQKYRILADEPSASGTAFCKRIFDDADAQVKLIAFNRMTYSGQVNVLPGDNISSCQNCSVFSDIRCQFSGS